MSDSENAYGERPMNVTSLDDLRKAKSEEQGLEDERMEQIRELLLGDHYRLGDARIARLEQRMADLELLLSKRLDALSARIEALGGEMESERRASFDELARAVDDLSRRIQRLGKS